MGTAPPTLEYAAAKPHASARKWARRIALGVLVLACLYATPIAWLYWGWRQEQPAREMVERVGAVGGAKMEPAGPDSLEQLIPARLGWIRERVTDITLMPASSSNDDLRTLRRLNRLKRLNLRNAQDEGLGHLERLKELQGLYLGGELITDAGLVHLKGLTGLRCLFLAGTRVTYEGVAELQKELPGCQIFR